MIFRKLCNVELNVQFELWSKGPTKDAKRCRRVLCYDNVTDLASPLHHQPMGRPRLYNTPEEIAAAATAKRRRYYDK